VGTGALRRREFIGTGLAAAGTLALGPAFWKSLAAPAQPGNGPYGPLGDPDPLGLSLPEGFTSRLIARGGSSVDGTGYVWHIFPDGSATFPTSDGGWILVSNCESPTPVHLPISIGNPGDGGVSAMRFTATGEIKDAYRILEGTSTNCAGGKTPWGTWLSCEETDTGRVWECDPAGERDPVVHDAMGVFTHEAVCIDRHTGFAYLSEDDGAGCLYRFRPLRDGDLSEGALEVAKVGRKGRVEWIELPDPSATASPTRDQVEGATRFKRGEGIWYDGGFVYLATTSDSRIWAYNTRRQTIRVIYDPQKVTDPPLTDVDNVTIHKPSGDLFVCEDNGAPDAYDIALVTPGGRRHKRPRTVARFAKVSGPQHGEPDTEAASELSGVCFNPRGDRMYFNSQRAYGVGEVYEVSGPFRRNRKRRR
jgi:secreted PhoX family phosphatase